jgi:hypothetical protein
MERPLLPEEQSFGVYSDTGSSVTNTYQSPSLSTGKIERTDMSLGRRELSWKDENELHEMYTMFAGSHEWMSAMNRDIS